MPGNAPVEQVGGTQDGGPWPSHVDEIVEGEQYDREVDGAIVTVSVTNVVEMDRGEAVAYQYGGGN